MPGWGRAAYEGYTSSGDHFAGRSSVTGEKLPSWDEQKPEIRARWEKAADAVVLAYIGRPEDKPEGT